MLQEGRFAEQASEYTFYGSMFQIYNETILDLLNMDESMPMSRMSQEDAFKVPLSD